MNWPLIFTLFNIQRPHLCSHCELYNVIKKAGRASKQMDMKQTLDNNIFIEAKMEAHKINDYICKTGLTAIFFGGGGLYEVEAFRVTEIRIKSFKLKIQPEIRKKQSEQCQSKKHL